MKILTVLVPVYNTEKYIKRCLDSLITAETKNEIEIIAVNDGSKDSSADIIKEYCRKYPDTVFLIDKENGGHGSTINAGLEKATGKYFRVLDSDDWFDSQEFVKFIKKLKNEDADLVVCNYRKEYTFNSKSEYFEYTDLSKNTVYNFDAIDLNLLKGEYFVMATSTYKTDILRKAGLKLLEKTFYVDMQFNIVPITEVNDFVYYDLDIYRYFIGRPEQSMNMDNFVRNKSHHEKMIKWIIDYYTEKKAELSPNKREYIEIILTYTLNTHYSIYCQYDKDYKTAKKEVRDFDGYLLEKNKDLYDRSSVMGYIRYNRQTNFKMLGKHKGKIYTLLKLVKDFMTRKQCS